MTSDDRWLLHSAEGRRPPKDPLERQPESRKLLPERMRQWAPQDRRLLHSTQSEAFRLGTLLSENYYKSAPSKPGLARRFRNPKILSAANAKADPLVRGKDELNYRTVPANVDDPSTSALLFPNRKGSTLRLHRNLSLPTTVVGELLTRDGQLVPIVPRAWKLAAAEKPKGTRPSTRSAGGFSISSLQASLVPDSPHQRASSGLLQVLQSTEDELRPSSRTTLAGSMLDHDYEGGLDEAEWRETWQDVRDLVDVPWQAGSAYDDDGGGHRHESTPQAPPWADAWEDGAFGFDSAVGDSRGTTPGSGSRPRSEPWEKVHTDDQWIAGRSPNLLARQPSRAAVRSADKLFHKTAMPIGLSCLRTH